MPTYQTLTLNLDTGELGPQPVRLPVGYEHIIRLSLIKGGVSGYELPAGSSITALFDDAFPVDPVSAVYTIGISSWVWDPARQVYEAGFNASQRPLSIIGLSTFASRLTVIDGGTITEASFHTTFRNSPLPPGNDPCSVSTNTLPDWFQNWVSQNFRYNLLPDQPTLPAAGVDAGSILAALNIATQAQKDSIVGLLEGSLTPNPAIVDIADISERADEGKIYRIASDRSVHIYVKDDNGGDWLRFASL